MKDKPSKFQTKFDKVRIAGRLRELITVRDEAGNIVHRFTRPLMLEFHTRDVLQITIGAAILAMPVGFTEEVWNLSHTLPASNTMFIGILSIVFMAAFVYYNYYRNSLKEHISEFTKRVVSTYVISLAVVGVFLTAIEAANWQANLIPSIKMVVLVAFPSSLSAAVVDLIK